MRPFPKKQLTLNDAEIYAERRILGTRLECPRCRLRYGATGMDKIGLRRGPPQLLLRITDKELGCMFCGYRVRREY